ncbi:MAG: hypothetical protein KAS23_06095 [Anaerohalosphaera sp.]|nr:hypothetical protein [Anaerohalosphaera sp.]
MLIEIYQTGGIITNGEQRYAGILRTILNQSLTNKEIEESSEFLDFLGWMERFIPAMLSEVYSQWKFESIDAFRSARIQKNRVNELEFLGQCLLISDQTWIPIHFRIQVSSEGERIDYFQCYLGKKGDGQGELERIPYRSSKLANKQLNALCDCYDSIEWVYKIEAEGI